MSDPELLRVWLEKNEGSIGKAAYEEEFWHFKEERLFDGLDELYKLWKKFSESGSHTNINSIVQRFVIVEGASHVEWRLNYTGLKPEILIALLFEMLLTFHVMEVVLSKDCEDRLKLDPELTDMRGKFQRGKEQLRQELIVYLKIPRPTAHA